MCLFSGKCFTLYALRFTLYVGARVWEVNWSNVWCPGLVWSGLVNFVSNERPLHMHVCTCMPKGHKGGLKLAGAAQQRLEA